MGTNKLPDYRLKQKLLYIDKTSPATLISYGDMYLKAGALSDALDFYARAAHRAGLEKIKALALEQGDAFLFQGAAKALGISLAAADWEAVAGRAADLGKYFFARRALEKTNSTELIEALAAKMKAEEAKQGA
ncbi:MAG: hypothetical protein PHG54_11050 [Smithellaceae bacterium]|nr:hypothetical protein [Syntrophaceae bacterium]MDD4241956.1 hypothetical protein [Smithellaceae bacterium]NLX53031.1 hypothetical protein [Deltaproteobacteria bacterium]